MKYILSSLLVAIWISCGGPLLSQSPLNGFHWDWRKSENDNWVILDQSRELPRSERVGLSRALARNVKSDQELQAIARQTRVKIVHLKSNDEIEVAAQSSDRRACSPTGNCEFWVLRKRGDHYVVILHRGAAQTFTIQPTVTNGFHDLVLAQHGSATEQGLTLYRFDGSRYLSVACYDASWAILEKEEVKNLKEPRITPCSKN